MPNAFCPQCGSLGEYLMCQPAKEMEETKTKLQQRLQEREKELLELRKAVETLKNSAQTTVEDSERIFTEMIRSIERRRSEVTELIRAQEKAEVSRAEGLLKRLEQEIAELKRRDAELEQLSHTDDHIHFLKNFQSVSPQPQSKDLSSTSVSQSWSFEAVKGSVCTLKGHLEDFFKQEVMKISATGVPFGSPDPKPLDQQPPHLKVF
ncbi:uncharacterized protein LOC143106391 [Alosa pseudoharengus]|uniref:uncharacterized protein LOC143106391 n=1 Tax=Alosa pseudoharengus TaxID=34774 RepID=UPI003F88BC79